MTHAFIDENKIKIVNDQGVEFEQLITATLQAHHYNKKLFQVFTVFFVILAALTVFLGVFTETSWVKILIPGVLAFLSLIFVDNYRVDSINKGTLYHHHVGKFNLAKTQLQPEIMRLQKELAQHEGDMQRIRSQSKFDFKKHDLEMTA